MIIIQLNQPTENVQACRFSKRCFEQVLGVVGEMAATGKKIEVNSVLDKLMRGV